ncbi:hypothetical protein D3C86_1305220 [compost metagenome]
MRFSPASKPYCRCIRSPRPWPKPCRNCRSSTRKSSRLSCSGAPRRPRWPWPSANRCWPSGSSARSTRCWPATKIHSRPPMRSDATRRSSARCSTACSRATRRSRSARSKTVTPVRDSRKSPSCSSSSRARWTRSSKPRRSCSRSANRPRTFSACRKPCSTKPHTWPAVSKTWSVGAPPTPLAVMCWACWRWLRSS